MLGVQKYVLDINFLEFCIGVLIPIAVAIVTRSSASSRVKAITNITLGVIAVGVQRLLAANGVVNLRTFLTTLLVTEIVAVATYYGFLKPTGTTAAVANATDGVGIGGNSSSPDA